MKDYNVIWMLNSFSGKLTIIREHIINSGVQSRELELANKRIDEFQKAIYRIMGQKDEIIGETMNNQNMADRTFLALAIYREARGESKDGKIGVAMTTLNRVNKPSWWGHNVMEVLFKKWQYSSLTDPKDKQLTVWPIIDNLIWQECLEIACDALDGKLENPVPGADSYYDTSISSPKWTESARFVKKIGRLVFFDVDHDFESA